MSSHQSQHSIPLASFFKQNSGWQPTNLKIVPDNARKPTDDLVNQVLEAIKIVNDTDAEHEYDLLGISCACVFGHSSSMSLSFNDSPFLPVRRRSGHSIEEHSASKLPSVSNTGSRWKVEFPSNSPKCPVRGATDRSLCGADGTCFSPTPNRLPTTIANQFQKDAIGKINSMDAAALSEYVGAAVRISAGVDSKYIPRKDSQEHNTSGYIVTDRTENSEEMK